MDAKLKALKVVDLKDILAKANVSITGKANKQDLIAKILGAPEAIDVYNKLHGPPPAANPAENASTISSATLEKPEAPQPLNAPAPASPLKSSKAAPVSSKPASRAAPKAPDAPATTSPSSTPPAKEDTDAEAEKRKARAARFNIPVVEPKSIPAQKNGKAAANGKPEKGVVSEDAEKLAARAARFGTQAPSAEPAKSNGRKRAAPPSGPIDEEELARRKKRAERFGIPLVGA